MLELALRLVLNNSFHVNILGNIGPVHFPIPSPWSIATSMKSTLSVSLKQPSDVRASQCNMFKGHLHIMNHWHTGGTVRQTSLKVAKLSYITWKTFNWLHFSAEWVLCGFHASKLTPENQMWHHYEVLKGKQASFIFFEPGSFSEYHPERVCEMPLVSDSSLRVGTKASIVEGESVKVFEQEPACWSKERINGVYLAPVSVHGDVQMSYCWIGDILYMCQWLSFILSLQNRQLTCETRLS